MAAATRNSSTADPLVFEVATHSSDVRRARLSVAGMLTEQTAALLCSALYAHLRTGRRDLRLDIADAVVIDDAAVAALRDAARAAQRLGGQLVVDNADLALRAELAELAEGQLVSAAK